jgi:hypothetical protein
MIPTPHPPQATRSTLSPCETKLWSQGTICRTRHQFPPHNKAGKKFIQEVCGIFLFLTSGIDGGLLPALSTLALQQSAPTEQMMTLCKQFLDYIALQPEAILTCNASIMVLAMHSDASYLSEPNARSRTGGHMFMATDEEIPQNNSTVLNISQIIHAVMSSTAEME